MHIKLLGTADGEDVFALCVAAGVSALERTGVIEMEEEEGVRRWREIGKMRKGGRVGQEKNCAYGSVANTEIKDTDIG